MNATLRLHVVGGRQRGAGRPLAAGAAFVVGRALDADVVLREPGLAARALRLRVHEDGTRVALECLTEGVRADGETLLVGDVVTLLPGASIELGSLALALAADGVEPPGAGVPDPANAADAHRAPDGDPAHVEAGAGAAGDDERDAERHGVTETDDEGGDAADVSPPVAAPARRSFVSFGSIVVLGCLALSGWLWYSGDGVAEGPSFGSRLEMRFPELTLGREAGGAPVVRGFVPARADAIALERWLAAQPERVASAVLVDTELVERVEDVFRVNGVEAAVRSLVAGEAVVDVRTADVEALARLETRVTEDVPQLVALTLENSPPPVLEDAVPVDPGKRVELVVATDPAYVVTRDRSRYFVGALLPSGHRIAGIEEGVVHLEKGDTVTELKF